MKFVARQVQRLQHAQRHQRVHVPEAVPSRSKGAEGRRQSENGVRAELQTCREDVGRQGLLMRDVQFLQLPATFQVLDALEPVVVHMQNAQADERLDSGHAAQSVVLQVKHLKAPRMLEAREGTKHVVVGIHDGSPSDKLQCLTEGGAQPVALQLQVCHPGEELLRVFAAPTLQRRGGEQQLFCELLRPLRKLLPEASTKAT
mmetsp:Transcript_133612/g.333463  ORF Transcript_133612/g.333463 Transcript_133612/m.333463 type:complete len:202 (-) Transcript_133612:143-748(-)